MDKVMGESVNRMRKNISAEEIEIYNEISAQHELAYILREILGKSCKIYLERNIEDFGLRKKSFLKKEMDISIVDRDWKSRHCIELKYPRRGQHPEQMFKVCEDVRFLEQLKNAGFTRNYFIMFCEDYVFYSDIGGGEIYELFRKNKTLKGRIVKPTGKKDKVVNLDGEYPFSWTDIVGDLKYFMIRV